MTPLAGIRSLMEILQVNGIRVLYLKNQSFLTSIQILTDAGSSVETADIYGMAHILEHMFFKGSKKRPTPTAISRAANDIGGKMNAYTSYDHTSYYITVLNESFEEGLDILADMYQNPIFAESEFRKEINPILSEYREREDDPENFLFERTLENFLGEGYHPIIGTKESIESATVDKMRKFKDQYYDGSHLLVVVVGGVALDRVVRAMETSFVPVVSTPRPVTPMAGYTKGELLLRRSGIQEAYYTLLYPALPLNDPRRYKEDMMNYLLGGNDSALLFERIREELGLSTYGIYTFVMRHDSFNVLGISCGIDPEQLDQLHGEVESQIARICNDLMDEAHLNRARVSLRTSIAARTETSASLAGMISVGILKGEKENPVEKALREIESVTLEEIREAAQLTFSHPLCKAVLVPDEDDEYDEE